MKKTVLIFGVIAGIIVSAMLFISFSGNKIDFSNGELTGYVTMIIAFSTIFFAIKTHRDKHLKGTISFGKAFQTGLYITIIASTLYVSSWMIISGTYGKNYMNQYYEYAIEELKNGNYTQEEINSKIEEMEKFQELYKNPFVKIGVTYLEILPVGLLISLICATILKRKKNLFKPEVSR